MDTIEIRGKPLELKLYHDNQTLEQVLDFRYLSYDASFWRIKDLVKKKLHKFQHICGSLSRILRNKAEKRKQI